jgi:hypothetical protein
VRAQGAGIQIGDFVKDKQNIRYLGFACIPEGGRSLEFSFETADRVRASMTFEIAAIFFSGEKRILIQEAAGICYAKLRDVLDTGSYLPSRCLITSNDIVQYRQVPAARGHRERNQSA